MTDRDVFATDRGVSAIVSYALVLGIVALLTTALFVGFAPFVTNQQHDSVHATLEVLGNDIAGDVDSVDRLASHAGNDATIDLQTNLPDRAGGATYTIEFKNETDPDRSLRYDYAIELRSTDPDTMARVSVRTQRPIQVEPRVLDGGTIATAFAADENELEVRHV